MKIPDGDWKAFVVRSLAQGTILAACVVGAMHVAHAWEGRSGVEARSFFTIAGTLTGVPASPTPALRFTFHKVGETAPCPPIDAVMVAYNGTTFSAHVPYEACGRGYFDGANITFDVAVNGTSVVVGQAVNPVPYAHFASAAGTANVATQYGTPDCPVGYNRTSEGAPSGRWYCRGYGADDVVRVGNGPSTFWIDRYEATVWTTREAFYSSSPVGTSLFGDSSDIPVFPRNGQWRDGRTGLPLQPPAYAVSVATGRAQPARWITWFQAQEACRASGKRLPTGEEWLTAAQGTIDPGSNDGSRNRSCHTTGTGPRVPGDGTDCVSGWGAQDMIGNVWEWTDEWYASVGQVTSATDGGAGELSGRRVNDQRNVWGTGFAGDGTWNVSSVVLNGNDSDNQMGLPSAASRGGSWSDGERSGVFALLLYGAPSSRSNNVGFRCVIPR